MDNETASQLTESGGASAPAAQGLQASPFFLVRDVVASAEYYRDKLGFAEPSYWGEPPCFAIVRLGQASFMLSQPEQALTILPNWGQNSFSWDAHVLVANIETLYAQCRERGAKILRELAEAPYGMLEFVVQDVDGYAICFGQDL